jgi:hypothetical protein
MMEGNSGFSTFNFVFTRTGDLSKILGFNAIIEGSGANPATIDGSGSDVVGITFNGFRAGEATTTVGVFVRGDTISEPNETFTVRLANFNDPRAINDLVNGIATGTILDDDGPTGFNDDGRLALLPPSGSEDGAVVYSPPLEMMMIASFAIV